MRLLYSSRTIEDVIYRAELDKIAADGDGVEVAHTLTRAQPDGWTGFARRIDPEMLREVAWPATEGPRVFVCGATRFVEAVAGWPCRPGLRPAVGQDRAVRGNGG